MIVRIQANGGSFRGAGQYYLHDKQSQTATSAERADASLDKGVKPQTDERVWFTDTRNCLERDPARALDEMWRTAEDQAYLKMQAGVQRGGRVCEEPVKTLSLSWHKDDGPEPQHMVEAADAFLRHMGWDAHQAVLVGHNDTEHRHIHVILNRVNPDTGRTLDDYREQKRAQEWALQYERSQDQVRCEPREINAARQQEKGAERERAGAQQHTQEERPAPYVGRAANDHLPHNVIMIGRPHEQVFNAEEKLRAEHDQVERLELKAEQRAEREAFFANGAKLFKATRHAVYDEVRKEYAPEWRQFYKDSEAATRSADASSESAVSRALYFAKDGKWDAAREAFADRNSVRDAVAQDMAERKADLKARQTEDLRERQSDACDALRDVREVQYQELLQRQRDERAAFRASETLDASSIGRERQVDGDGRSLATQAANENRTIEVPQLPASERGGDVARSVPFVEDGKRRELAPIGTKLPEAVALSDGIGHTDVASVASSPLEAPVVTHQLTDLAAGAIGSVASYLADQLGELFAPTPPEVREAQAKADAKRDAAREAEQPKEDDRAAAYARIIDNAVRLTEAERAQQGDAYWKERDRDKGWERDQ